jgi:hypothetical protein
MSTYIHSIRREDQTIVSLDGVPYVVDSWDDNFDIVNDLLDSQDAGVGLDPEELLELLNPTKELKALAEAFLEEGLELGYDGEAVTYMGNTVPSDLGAYIQACSDDSNPEPAINFVKSLYNNPNENTRQALYRFVVTNGMPILDNGAFLAYKVVRGNYMDKHSNSFDNTPGRTCELKSWAEVDTNPAYTCSRGLHVCSKAYIPAFYSPGDRVVVVAVMPEDVGAVPDDYEGSKMRTRKYLVMFDVTSEYEVQKDEISVSIRDEKPVMGGLKGVDPAKRGPVETRVAWEPIRW